jgi:hypothetical protein
MSAEETKTIIAELHQILEETLALFGEPVGRRESRPTVLPNETKNHKATRKDADLF